MGSLLESSERFEIFADPQLDAALSARMANVG
jgi:hypothetical protein